jgi:hypothetical protein
VDTVNIICQRRHPGRFVFDDGVISLQQGCSAIVSDSVFQALSDSVRKAEDTSLFATEAIESRRHRKWTVSDMARYYIVAGCFRDEANANCWSILKRGTMRRNLELSVTCMRLVCLFDDTKKWL